MKKHMILLGGCTLAVLLGVSVAHSEKQRITIPLSYPIPREKESLLNMEELPKVAQKHLKVPLPPQSEKFHALVAKCLRDKAPLVRMYALHYAVGKCGCITCDDILHDYLTDVEREHMRHIPGNMSELLLETYLLVRSAVFEQDLEGKWEIAHDEKRVSVARQKKEPLEKVRYLRAKYWASFADMKRHDSDTKWAIERLAFIKVKEGREALKAIEADEKLDHERRNRPYWEKEEAFIARAVKLHSLVMKTDTRLKALGEALKEPDGELAEWAIEEAEYFSAKEAVPYLRAAIVHHKKEYHRDKDPNRESVRELIVNALRGFEVEVREEEKDL